VSWNTWPSSRIDATKIAVPLGCVYTPMKKIDGLLSLPYEVRLTLSNFPDYLHYTLRIYQPFPHSNLLLAACSLQVHCSSESLLSHRFCEQSLDLSLLLRGMYNSDPPHPLRCRLTMSPMPHCSVTTFLSIMLPACRRPLFPESSFQVIPHRLREMKRVDLHH